MAPSNSGSWVAKDSAWARVARASVWRPSAANADAADACTCTHTRFCSAAMSRVRCFSGTRSSRARALGQSPASEASRALAYRASGMLGLDSSSPSITPRASATAPMRRYRRARSSRTQGLAGSFSRASSSAARAAAVSPRSVAARAWPNACAARRRPRAPTFSCCEGDSFSTSARASAALLFCASTPTRPRTASGLSAWRASTRR